MTISTQFILFSVEVYPIATTAADFSLCIFDRYSFIFCESGTGTKLLHSMINDIPSQQRMKNKLDFPMPFPDQHHHNHHPSLLFFFFFYHTYLFLHARGSFAPGEILRVLYRMSVLNSGLFTSLVVFISWAAWGWGGDVLTHQSVFHMDLIYWMSTFPQFCYIY